MHLSLRVRVALFPVYRGGSEGWGPTDRGTHAGSPHGSHSGAPHRVGNDISPVVWVRRDDAREKWDLTPHREPHPACRAPGPPGTSSPVPCPAASSSPSPLRSARALDTGPWLPDGHLTLNASACHTDLVVFHPESSSLASQVSLPAAECPGPTARGQTWSPLHTAHSLPRGSPVHFSTRHARHVHLP